MKLYGMPGSGNCYKVAWMLSVLDMRCEIVSVDTSKGQTKAPEFLSKNPAGQVPLLELDNEKRLSESNAILLYLAEKGGKLLPDDAWQRAQVYQWLFFEQYSHEPTIAVRRANFKFNKGFSEEKLQDLLERGNKALAVMEKQLEQTPFLAGSELSVADMSLYAYTHVAQEGEYDLSVYPNIQAWIERVKTSDNYVGMEVLEI